jgi:hypothetical protein
VIASKEDEIKCAQKFLCYHAQIKNNYNLLASEKKINKICTFSRGLDSDISTEVKKKNDHS